ncbi:HigA family addiction module antitoxin [Agrobacterium vitis]
MANEPIHPGQHIRTTYLTPRKISVTDAAKLIGISRPGVSNFLNGKVSTTPDMAARIETAFGMPAATLLEMQAAFDAHGTKTKSAPTSAKAYVPPFLSFKANDVSDWVDHNIPARARLSVFLRTLVNSTGGGLEKVDFPGNDDAERAGWDGWTEARDGTPWIPAGTTGWEFGVNEDPKAKADGDFAKSVKAYKRKADRDQITFIFATPRRWPSKAKWIADMKAKMQWKDVRAYDASDLEQWMEQSLAGQAWFANETERPSQGVRSLDKCWSDWASVAKPALDGSLFKTAIDIARDKFKGFLARPASEPMVIAGDSVEEALAFLSQLFSDPELTEGRDRALVFDQVGVLPKLAQGSKDFIAVIHSRDVERELGPYSNSLRSIVLYPRNATNSEPHIILEPLGYEAFRVGLEAMGYDRDDITKHGNASGRSLTVLRRQLSNVEAVRTPEWAADNKIASSMVPLMLVGAWNADNESDQIALSLLAGDVPYEELERRIQELLALNDAPVWSIGGYRGVISKIDALFAIAKVITHADLKRYLDLAKVVLGEDDPALDLPEKERWAAASHGKQREFSGALREGISETLVLLAVHGDPLFKTRLGFDGEVAASRLVMELLEPLSTRKIEANERDLPVYAEAAPDTFLKIFERDLKTEQPASISILKSIEAGLFGFHSSRVGLLWALEGLAWNPTTLARAVLILGRLACVEINDNYGNKPIASLESIFRAWMPQTAADHDQRLKALMSLLEKFPSVGWKVCIDQFGHYGNSVGDYSHKPKWRPDGYGFGEPFKFMAPIHAFIREMVEVSLTRPSYSADMLCDLVDRMHGLADKDQERVWKLIEAWKGSASDLDIAKVREKLRVTVLSRRGRRRAKDEGFATLTKTAKAVYAAMEPTDLTNKHEWLFRQSWVEESADELDDDELDFRKREERVEQLRVAALKEVFTEQGMDGIFALAEQGKAQSQIGWHLIRSVLGNDEKTKLIVKALQPGSNDLSAERKNLIFGALRAMTVEDRAAFFATVRSLLSEGAMLTLLLLSPFSSGTWAIVDALSEVGRQGYWQDVNPEWIFEPEAENIEAIERMLKAERPRAAFAAVHFKLEAISPTLLYRMLSGIAKDGKDKSGEYQLQEYDIKTAFSLLDRNADVTLEEKAGLEFAYIEVLSRAFGNETQHIPNVERYIEMHPEMYVQALVWAYRRNDGREDPEKFRTPEGRDDLAMRGYRLLEGIERIPGHDKKGELRKENLAKWVSEVRKLAAELDRLAVCDICLGKLFSSAPPDADGNWPCEPVRDVMEELQSEEISRGAHTGLYNARGVHWRGEGGGQERELADKYRIWAEAIQFSHPFVSSTLLMEMVNTYQHEADREDNEAGIHRRLRH